MKFGTIAAVAVALGTLSACNNTAREQAADNVEANGEAQADAIESNADNVPGVTLNDTADNAADATREASEDKAEAIRNGTAPVNGQ